MATQKGYERCIRAGTAFKKLPKGFFILFSKLAVTNVRSTGDAARYQVILGERSFLQQHMDSCTPYGLAQFINCCLSSNSAIEGIEGHNMKTKQCEFITKMDQIIRITRQHTSKSWLQSKKMMSCSYRVATVAARGSVPNFFVFLRLYCCPLFCLFLNCLIN